MSFKKQLPQHLNLFVALALFFTILSLTYLIAARHNRRFDFTREKVHSAAPETADILERMKQGKIMVRAFFANEDPTRFDVEILLKSFATHHPNFRYEFFDPDRSPSEARRHRIDTYQTLLVEYGGRSQRVQEFTEESLTNTLIRLARPEKRMLCFASGHGENSVFDTERTGLSEWRLALEEQQFEVREIQIASEGIPEECSAVVVAGPRYELLEKETELLQKYPEAGKGFLLLIDPMDPGQGKSFHELLGKFGLKLGDDVVIDKVSQVVGGDFLVPLVSQYAAHPVTEKFRVATFFPIARTVRKSPDAPKDLEITELAQTSQGSWAETNLKKLETGEAQLDSEHDLPGPVNLAVAVELKEAPRGARIVVMGDSDFLTNAHFRLSGNKDLALNTLNWLVKDDRWIAIRAKELRFEPLFLKVNQSVGVAAYAVAGLPLTVFVVGSVGILIRRSKSA